MVTPDSSPYQTGAGSLEDLQFTPPATSTTEALRALVDTTSTQTPAEQPFTTGEPAIPTFDPSGDYVPQNYSARHRGNDEVGVPEVSMRPDVQLIDISRSEGAISDTRSYLQSLIARAPFELEQTRKKTEMLKTVALERVQITTDMQQQATELDSEAQRLGQALKEAQQRHGAARTAQEEARTRLVASAHARELISGARGLQMSTVRQAQEAVNAANTQLQSHEAERQKLWQDLCDEQERHRNKIEELQARKHVLSVEHTDEGTPVNLANINDPHAITDDERTDYSVPDTINYRLSLEHNPTAPINPRIERDYVITYIEQVVIPRLRQALQNPDMRAVANYDQNILPQDRLILEQKTEALQHAFDQVRATDRQISTAQLVDGDHSRRAYEEAIRLTATSERVMEDIQDKIEANTARAGQIPVPSNVPVLFEALQRVYGRDRAQEVLALPAAERAALPTAEDLKAIARQQHDEGGQELVVAPRGMSLLEIGKSAIGRRFAAINPLVRQQAVEIRTED